MSKVGLPVLNRQISHLKTNKSVNLTVNRYMFIAPILRDGINCIWSASELHMKREKSYNCNSLMRTKDLKHNLFDQLIHDYSYTELLNSNNIGK